MFFLHLDREAANLTDAAMLAEETGLALVERAYELVSRAWLELAESGLMFIEENGSKPSRPDQLIQLMEDLQSKFNIRAWLNMLHIFHYIFLLLLF